METLKAYVSRFHDTRRAKSGSKFPVKMTIYFDGQKKRYKTGVDLSVDEYSKLNQPNLRDDNLKLKRRKIEVIVIKAEQIIKNLEPFSFCAFEKEFVGEKIARRSAEITDLFVSYCKQLEDNEQIGTAQSYKCTLNSILRFRNSTKLNDITRQWLKDYEKFMREIGSSPSTIGIYMRQLRRIINVAINDGLLSPDKYPFKGYAIPASRNIKKALSENQVIALLNYETEDFNKRRALDFWLFSYVCNGMNMADICMLTKDKIRGDFFSYFRAKTKNTKKKDLRPIKVPLTELSRRILAMWESDDKTSRYAFPILREGLTAKQIKYKVQDHIAYVNKYMKLVAADVGIQEKIGTYVARHTHSTMLKRKGVPTEFIKENLGHSSVLTTENYLADFTDETKLEYAQLLTEFNKIV